MFSTIKLLNTWTMAISEQGNISVKQYVLKKSWSKTIHRNGPLGKVQTPYFTWAESSANEGEQRILLICIRFGSCEVRRLNLALVFPLQLDVAIEGLPFFASYDILCVTSFPRFCRSSSLLYLFALKFRALQKFFTFRDWPLGQVWSSLEWFHQVDGTGSTDLQKNARKNSVTAS